VWQARMGPGVAAALGCTVFLLGSRQPARLGWDCTTLRLWWPLAVPTG
jgi:hypothetical protein